jgi:hypothetical protein
MAPELRDMLATILPLTLGEVKDERHRFQQQLVQGIAKMLKDIEATLKQQVADKKLECEAAAVERNLCDSEASEAAGNLRVQAAETYRLKVALAEKAKAFRMARSALAEVDQVKTLEERKCKNAEKKKSDCAKALENLRALQTVAPQDADSSEKAMDLIEMLKTYKFDDSMLIAAPAALRKDPNARGQFDLFAISLLETQLGKLAAEQDETLTASAPVQARLEAAIKQAQAHLAVTKSEQQLAAKSFDAAFRQQATCEAADKAAKMALCSIALMIKDIDKALSTAEVELEAFQQGPQEIFKELCERSTPPSVETELTVEAFCAVDTTDGADMELIQSLC